MKNFVSGAARATLLLALPLCAVAAKAQVISSGVTTYYGGAPITYGYAPNTGYYNQPQSVAGLIANQNIYGQSAPNPTPNYSRFGYANNMGYGYRPYRLPGSNIGPLPSPFTDQDAPAVVIVPAPTYGYAPTYAYPTPVYSYPVPVYAYPVPAYPYPAPAYGYGYGGNGYGYGNGSYQSRSTGYGVTFGNGGLSVSIGGRSTSGYNYNSTTIGVR